MDNVSEREYLECFLVNVDEILQFFGPMTQRNVLNYLYYFQHTRKLLNKPLPFHEPGLKTISRLLGKEEFICSLNFNAQFFDQAMSCGVFPMGGILSGIEIVLLKLHTQRCLLYEIRDNLHISKQTKKKAKNYVITVNRDIATVIKNIKSYHSQRNWVRPRLESVYWEFINGNNPDLKNQIISFELWNISKENPVLVAGEFGYVTGSCYTSFSGYHTENNSGNIQLVATALILANLQFKVWDLGMEMVYKVTLGGKNYLRDQFVCIQNSVKDDQTLPFPTDAVSVDSLIKEHAALN